MRRRTVALLELAVAGFGLLVGRYLRKRAERADEPIPHLPYWIGVGASSSVVYHWAYDRDVAGVRTKRLRRALAVGGWTLLSNWLLPRSAGVTQSFVTGSNLGTLLYRSLYGLLRPLPGSAGDE